MIGSKRKEKKAVEAKEEEVRLEEVQAEEEKEDGRLDDNSALFQVDGAGYFELYQNTLLPDGFEHRWQEWCAAELS